MSGPCLVHGGVVDQQGQTRFSSSVLLLDSVSRHNQNPVARFEHPSWIPLAQLPIIFVFFLAQSPPQTNGSTEADARNPFTIGDLRAAPA